MSALSPSALVAEFHRAFGHPIATEPTIPDEATRALRLALIREEAAELREAVESGDRVRIASEAADVVIVCWGAALAWGVVEGVVASARPEFDGFEDLEEDVEGLGWAETVAQVVESLAWIIGDAYATARTHAGADAPLLDLVIAETMAANMRKLGPDGKPILRADGKVTKPAGWQPADIAAVLAGIDVPADPPAPGWTPTEVVSWLSRQGEGSL